MSNPYGLPQGVNDQSRIGGAAFRRIFGVLNSQLQGVLDALLPPDEDLATGTDDDSPIEGDVTTTAREGVVWGFEVTADDGLTLHVSAGAALASFDDAGGGLPSRVYLRSQGETLALTDDGEWWIYAAPVQADTTYAPDSREDAGATLLARDEEAGDGAVLLAHATVTAGSVTLEDRRTFIAAESLRRRIAQLETDTGYDADQRAKGSLAARLSLLEGPQDGDTSSSVALTYLSQLNYSAEDARPATVVVEEKLAALEARLTTLVQTGGVRPQQTPLDQLAHEHAITRQETGKTQLLLRKLVAEIQALDLNVQLPIEIGLERSQSANVVGTEAQTTIFGGGEAEFPTYLGPTTLVLQTDGSLEP